MPYFMKVVVAVMVALAPALAVALDSSRVEELMAQINKKNYSPVETFLETEKKSLAEDPDYYVILLNYVFSKGDRSGLVIAQGDPGPGDYVLRDADTGEATGFLGERAGFDKEFIVDGISRTQSALGAFESRLDIHFGIVEIAQRIERWDIVGDQIVRMLNVSKEIDNKWTWGSVNSMSGDPQEFMIQNILPRTSSMFRADKPDADTALVRVSESMIEHYPNLVYGYSNLGLLHFAKKEYAAAEELFLKALQIDPNDEVVKGNLENLRQQMK